MKFTVESKIIAKPLTACAKVCKFSNYNPVYAMIRVTASKEDNGKVTVEASDGAVNLSYTCKADVRQEGTHLVDGQRLYRFVTARAGTVRVHTTPRRMIVKNAGGKLWLNFYNGTTLFPEPPNLPIFAPIELDGEIIRDIMSIAFMGGKDGTQFDGLYIAVNDGRLETIATNGFRIGYAWNPVEWDGNISFVLPQYIATALPSFVLNDDLVELYITDKYLIFSSEEFIFYTKGLANTFPYEAVKKLMRLEVIAEMEVDVTEMADIIKMASFVADDSKVELHRIYFDTNGLRNELKITTAENSEIGGVEQTMKMLDHTGEDMHFILAPLFTEHLIRALEKIQNSSLFSIKDMTKTVVFGQVKGSEMYHVYSKYMNAKFAIAVIVAK
jgi:DNA polymerase III sliding clamp (beta) subunit (PCNA family)